MPLISTYSDILSVNMLKKRTCWSPGGDSVPHFHCSTLMYCLKICNEMTSGEDLFLMMRVKEIIWHLVGYLDQILYTYALRHGFLCKVQVNPQIACKLCSVKVLCGVKYLRQGFRKRLGLCLGW